MKSGSVENRILLFLLHPCRWHDLERSNRTHLGYPIQGELTRPFKTIDDGLFYAGQGAPLLSHHKATDLTRALAALIPTTTTP